MNILHFDTLPSAYTYVAENARTMASGTVVTADYQSAGRGQRGNTWESAHGQNLLMAMLVRPLRFPARSQFYISEAVSLAVAATLRRVCGVECRVKWPNDIYASDRKICGILISHSIEAPAEAPRTAPLDAPGTVDAIIAHTVIGIGVNLNQREFRSDAPNPVSVAQLTGRDTDRDLFLRTLVDTITSNLKQLQAPAPHAAEQGVPELQGAAGLHAAYMSALWRGDGAPHPFYDVRTGERFAATIQAVEPSGHLILRTAATSGRQDAPTLRRYAFKEVSWL